MIKGILKFAGLAILVLVCILLTRTMLYKSKQHNVETVKPVAISDSVNFHLSKAVQIPTISSDMPGGFDTVPFRQMIDFLARTYPLATTRLHRKTINQLSLLYTWDGRNPSLKPMILIGHMDVVPVGTEPGEQWQYPPFSGMIKDGVIWGRGTLDDKVNVIGILEAVEMLLKEGYQPERTIYLAFGHDEESGGEQGAEKIAGYLASQHVKADFLLDEGLVITHDIVPGVAGNVALVGIAEKGYVSVELSVEAEGGHSSMPAKETPIGILASAVSRLEKHPMKAQLSVPVQEFLDYVGPEMSFFSRLAFSNRWLLKGLIIKKYEASNAGNAIVRTTTAATLFRSGTKDNVLPGFASATVNFRIVPGESIEDVFAHIRNVVQDKRVKLKKVGHFTEPSPVSEIRCRAFEDIEKSIRQIFPNTLTAPSLVIAGTDARHYSEVAVNLYRFVPLIAMPDDLKRIHGVNEKISSPNFSNCIRFYRQLILNADSNHSDTTMKQ
ncbi:MAG TPA: M20 family peptidase [Bacteroidia bacterium]|jgi:carboxypeptidase PM20D1|nr:M20 family peptidase [Bacteroidia bacterium]